MTIAFMSLISALTAERINLRAGLWLLPFLLLVGMGSVLQWYWTELQGVQAICVSTARSRRIRWCSC